jgi:hypothetical protein
MTATRLGLAVVLGSFLASTVHPQKEAPTVVVDVVVRDRRQAPIADLKPTEIELRQDGVAQALQSLERSGPPGAYVIRYVPRSGRPGALTLRVLRPGSVASGPDGGALRITVVAPLNPLERRLVPLLEGPAPPSPLPHQPFVLRFEREGDHVHHTFVVEVPLAGLELVEAEGLVRGNLGLLARVKNAEGKVAHSFTLEYPVEAPAAERNVLRAERLVWTSHLHLPAGAYVLETAVADLLSSGGGAGRLSFEAPALPRGLHTSSVIVLAAGGALLTQETAADNPLRYGDRQLVPAFRRQFVAGGDEVLPFYVIVFPDASRSEPAQASVELYRGGSLVAQGPITLPAGPGPLPYLGSFPIGKLPVGTYEMRIVARQGQALFEQDATFDVVTPPRFEER